MVVAEVEILQQAKYLYISHAVQNTIQCVFLAFLTQKSTLKSKNLQFSHFYFNQLFSADASTLQSAETLILYCF